MFIKGKSDFTMNSKIEKQIQTIHINNTILPKAKP